MAGRLIILCLLPSMLLAPPPDSMTLTAEQVFNLYTKMRALEQKALKAEDEASRWRRRALSCRGREVS